MEVLIDPSEGYKIPSGRVQSSCIVAIPAVQRKESDSPKYIMRQGKTPAVFDDGVLTKSNHRAAIMMEK